MWYVLEFPVIRKWPAYHVSEFGRRDEGSGSIDEV